MTIDMTCYDRLWGRPVAASRRQARGELMGKSATSRVVLCRMLGLAGLRIHRLVTSRLGFGFSHFPGCTLYARLCPLFPLSAYTEIALAAIHGEDFVHLHVLRFQLL